MILSDNKREANCKCRVLFAKDEIIRMRITLQIEDFIRCIITIWYTRQCQSMTLPAEKIAVNKELLRPLTAVSLGALIVKTPKRDDFLATAFALMRCLFARRSERACMTRRPLVSECHVEPSCLRADVLTGPKWTITKPLKTLCHVAKSVAKSKAQQSTNEETWIG